MPIFMPDEKRVILESIMADNWIRNHVNRRFFSKVTITDTCWIWNGAIINKSLRGPRHYGSFMIKSVKERKIKVPAHVYSYWLFKGPIPKLMVLDHICRNRNCVRPDHLEPRTNRDNILIGDGFTAINAAKNNCPLGHDYTTYNDRKRGTVRVCKECSNASKQRTRKAKRGAVLND